MEKKTPFNPAGGLCFILGTNVFLFAANLLKIFPGDTRLMSGVCYLIGLPFYFMGAKALGARGDSYIGNLYIIFGALFCGEFGLSNLLGYFGDIYGWQFDCTLLCIPLFISGIISLPSMFPFRYGPWIPFVTWTCASMLVIASGFMYVFPGSAIIYYLNVILAIVTGTGVTYLGMAEMFACCGITISQGKRFKRKNVDEYKVTGMQNTSE